MKTVQNTILIICLLSVFSGLVYGQESSPSATPEADKTRQIEELKERLATKVAELRQTQRSAMAGTVQSTSVSTFVVEAKTKNVKIELTDDILVTQYVKGKRTKLTAADIEKGDPVVVFGEYDSTLDILKAKVVFIGAPAPVRVFGIIADIDRTEYTLTLNNPQGQSYVIDIEKTTKTFQWKNEATEKSGFSKVAIGDTVFVLGNPVPKVDNRLSGLRILDIGNLNGTATGSAGSAPEEVASPSPAVEETAPAQSQ